MKTITEQIRDAIEKSGYSQYRLAQETGISQGRISEFLAGRAVNSDTLDKLATALGISLKISPNPPKDS